MFAKTVLIFLSNIFCASASILFYLKHEHPNLATLSTGTTVHSIRMRRSCFRARDRDWENSLEPAPGIWSQFITSSVVRPMQCLKLGPEEDQPWSRKTTELRTRWFNYWANDISRKNAFSKKIRGRLFSFFTHLESSLRPSQPGLEHGHE